ncbi:MAG: hypothetical protein ABW220_08445 [Burkholderiaceae bacterium]
MTKTPALPAGSAMPLTTIQPTPIARPGTPDASTSAAQGRRLVASPALEALQAGSGRSRPASPEGASAPRQSLTALRTRSGSGSESDGSMAIRPAPLTVTRQDAAGASTPSTPKPPSPTQPSPTSAFQAIPPSPLPADHQALTIAGRVSQERQSLSAASLESRDAHAAGPHAPPQQAAAGRFFLAQNLRHAGPVAGVRTLVQGVIAPEVARAVVSHPNVALGVQVALTAESLGRRILSQLHSESSPQVANRAFAGDASGARNSLPRRAWQAVQTVGILGGDAAAVGLTVLARSRPELQPLAQSVAAIQVLSHLQSQLREMLRPAINTVHVGNGADGVPQPPEGRNLRGADMPLSMRATFGGAAAGIDLAGQLMQQFALGGQPAWNSPRGLALLAGFIGGVGNMVTSSVEDHMVDNASARRMQQTDPSHVTHLHTDFRNPFTRNELGRQAERADTRIFNTMIPALMALGVMQALQPSLTEPGVPTGGRIAAQASVHAACAGLMLGSLLALTVKSYQLNDDVRRNQTQQRQQATPA